MIPNLLVITDHTQCRLPLLDVVRQSIEAGAKGVLVRDKALPQPERHELLKNVSAFTAGTACQLLASSPSPFPVDGEHLASNDEVPETRPPVLGRSCHSLDEIAAAEADGFDYVTLSPIFATASKPGYGPILGLNCLERAAEVTSLPILALGGVEVNNARHCIDAGAQGAAVMGCVMRSANPGKTISSLVVELDLG